MEKIVRITITSLGTFLFIVAGQFNHIAALQMPGAINGMNHGGSTSLPNSSQTCTTLCTTMVVNKEDLLQDVSQKDDKEPEPPYYIQVQAPYFHTSDIQLISANNPDPPAKVPLFLLYSVIRV